MSRRADTVPPLTKRQKAEIWRRDQGRCQVCGKKLGPGSPGHVDHITPRSMGGSNDPENLRLVCAAFNTGKNNKEDTPAAARAARLHAKHFGYAAEKKRPLPFGRHSPLKRRVDGTVEKRETNDDD